MNIEFIKNNDNIDITDYIIRDVTTSNYYSEPTKKETHFQALLSGKDSSKNKIVDLLFKYYDENNNFLGLDKKEEWIKGKKPFALSIPVTIPDNAVRAEIDININTNYEMYLSIVGSIVFFILLILGINALFHLYT